VFPRSTFYGKINERLRSDMNLEISKSSRRKVGLFGGKRVGTPVRDTKTGVIYRSKYQAGKALAAEAGANLTDRFAWYKLISQFPGRFVEVTSGKSGEVYKGGKSKVRVRQTEQNDDLPGAIEAILCHKGKKMAEAARMRRKAEGEKERYGDHIQAILEHLAEGNLAKAFLAGALDAMIYDIACSLDFTKKKVKPGDYSGYLLRKRLIKRIFDEAIGW
jgi:hypothetical protein